MEEEDHVSYKGGFGRYCPCQGRRFARPGLRGYLHLRGSYRCNNPGLTETTTTGFGLRRLIRVRGRNLCKGFATPNRGGRNSYSFAGFGRGHFGSDWTINPGYDEVYGVYEKLPEKTVSKIGTRGQVGIRGPKLTRASYNPHRSILLGSPPRLSLQKGKDLVEREQKMKKNCTSGMSPLLNDAIPYRCCGRSPFRDEAPSFQRVGQEDDQHETK